MDDEILAPCVRYVRAIFLGLNGWFVIVLFYLVAIALIGSALYLVVRLGVLHAMKAHARWTEAREVGDG